MNTNTSRGLIGFVAAPVTAAAVMAGALGFASVAHAGVNVHASPDDAVAGVPCAAEAGAR
jgi:uroporphyrinogen-III decarboxylase